MNEPAPSAIEPVLAFIEGRLDTRTFEQVLYENAALEAVLSAAPAPRHAHTGVTLYQYLIALDYRDPGEVRNAQGALESFLREQNISFTSDNKLQEAYRLLLDAQPKWLNVDAACLQSLLDAAPALADKRAKKAWLQQRLRELFRCAKRPPRWLQSPAWPIGENGPLVFLGQMAVDDYFHDEAAVYVFHDPRSGALQSILQVA